MPAPKCKLICLGSSGVGKSSLLERYCLGTFSETIAATIGVDFRLKNVNIAQSKNNNGSSAAEQDQQNTSNNNNLAVQMQIFDTAGQERYRSLGSQFYRNSDGIILVYDVTSEDSFNALGEWLDNARKYLPDTPAMLIGNKIDLISNNNNNNNGESINTDSDLWRKQEQQKAEEFAREHQMLYCRCSAKTKEGVAHAFEEIGRVACDRPEYKEKYGLNNNNSDQQQGDGDGNSDRVGKRINLNATRDTKDDESMQGYGCGAC